jgi:hypothetical protein
LIKAKADDLNEITCNYTVFDRICQFSPESDLVVIGPFIALALAEDWKDTSSMNQLLFKPGFDTHFHNYIFILDGYKKSGRHFCTTF